MNLIAEGQVIGDHQVDHDLVQHLVLVTPGIQRRHEAGFYQTVNHVVLSLGDPRARSLQRTHILRVLAIVHRVVHLHADILAVPGRQLERVAPEVCLRFETDSLFAFNAGRLFHVNGYRQPNPRLHIHAPAIEVEVVL